jgi:hypothetical protein
MILGNSCSCCQGEPPHHTHKNLIFMVLFTRKLSEAKEEIERARNRKKFFRFVDAPYDAQSIIRHFRQLQAFINEIQVTSCRSKFRH